MSKITTPSLFKLTLLGSVLASVVPAAHGTVIANLGSAGATTWDPTPALGTAVPNATNTTFVGASPLQQTITVGSSSITLDKIAFTINTTTSYSASMTLSIYSVADPLAQGFTVGSNLLPGGGAFSYASAASTSGGILTLDLTGTDEISLSANTSYVISLSRVTATSNPAFLYFSAADNASSAYTGGALFYNRNYVSGTDGQDAAFAVYTTAVPEPSTFALIFAGIAGLFVGVRKRMRKS